MQSHRAHQMAKHIHTSLLPTNLALPPPLFAAVATVIDVRTAYASTRPTTSTGFRSCQCLADNRLSYHQHQAIMSRRFQCSRHQVSRHQVYHLVLAWWAMHTATTISTAVNFSCHPSLFRLDHHLAPVHSATSHMARPAVRPLRIA